LRGSLTPNSLGPPGANGRKPNVKWADHQCGGSGRTGGRTIDLSSMALSRGDSVKGRKSGGPIMEAALANGNEKGAGSAARVVWSLSLGGRGVKGGGEDTTSDFYAFAAEKGCGI